MAVVGEVTITGVSLEVGASAASGNFTLSLDGEVIGRGETLDKAKAQARAALAKRRVKVEVPFVTKQGERGVAHGIHQRNRTVLVRMGASGSAAELQGYSEQFRPDIPADVLERFLEAGRAAQLLEKERSAISKEWSLDLRKAVVCAIDEAVAEQEARS